MRGSQEDLITVMIKSGDGGDQCNDYVTVMVMMMVIMMSSLKRENGLRGSQEGESDHKGGKQTGGWPPSKYSGLLPSSPSSS